MSMVSTILDMKVIFGIVYMEFDSDNPVNTVNYLVHEGAKEQGKK